jgi:hypothetical protein
MQRAIKWMPTSEIDAPCADISFFWASEKGTRLVVVMHFSRVVGGFSKDLKLIFDRPLAVMWEEESFGLIETPKVLPKCSGAGFRECSHPTLIVEHSSWAEKYAANKYGEGDPEAQNVKHYFLVSLNDLVHVLAESTPEAAWVASVGS